MSSNLHQLLQNIGPGIFELQGSENRVLPLTWLVALTTIQYYRADSDRPYSRLFNDS